ncbi:hypothetical protein ACFUMH_10010 [Cellulomonas sp. NPDC057328]|uniref:hypothetical protein n=1 Tax=Cellulomonas sp. NPDC057328 TaxID=3346101 RepID=UPI003629A8D8
MRRPIAACLAAATTIALMAAVPAHAADHTEATADLIAEVAPDQGDVLAARATGENFAVALEASTVTVPTDAAAAVVLAAKADQSPLEVNLPAELSVSDGKAASDGTVVYRGVKASAAVQVLEDGSARLQTITHGADGPQEFTYTFGENVTPVEGVDGGIELLADYGGAALVVGTVDEAWAVDADGDTVQSSYRVEGGALVQVIEPSADTAYPVVADPKVTRTWWNSTLYLNRNETALMVAGAGGMAAVAALVPDPTISKIVAVGAGLSAAYIGLVHARGKCLKFVYYGNTLNIWQEYAGAEAGGYCR